MLPSNGCWVFMSVNEWYFDLDLGSRSHFVLILIISWEAFYRPAPMITTEGETRPILSVTWDGAISLGFASQASNKLCRHVLQPFLITLTQSSLTQYQPQTPSSSIWQTSIHPFPYLAKSWGTGSWELTGVYPSSHWVKTGDTLDDSMTNI